jgi:hypothetical protein
MSAEASGKSQADSQTPTSLDAQNTSPTLKDEANVVSLRDENWEDLLLNLHDGRCTPFLGAGASRPPLPSAAEIAKMWAEEFHYPLDDHGDLTRVAQFLAVTRSPRFAKSKIRDYFNSFPPPDFNGQNQIHSLLAELPIPV